MLTLAQAVAGGIGTYSIGQILIGAIIVIAIIAVFFAFVRYSGIEIPPIVITCIWILIGAVVAIFAIKFLMSLW